MISLIIFAVLVSTPISPRLYAIGDGLSGIVDDLSSDIVYNPAQSSSVDRFLAFSFDLYQIDDSLLQGIIFSTPLVAVGIMVNYRNRGWVQSGGWSGFSDSTSWYYEEDTTGSKKKTIDDGYSIIPLIGYRFSNRLKFGCSYNRKSYELGKDFYEEGRSFLQDSQTEDTIWGNIFDTTDVQMSDITINLWKLGTILTFENKTLDVVFGYGNSVQDSSWSVTANKDSFHNYVSVGCVYYYSRNLKNDGILILKSSEYSLGSRFSSRFGSNKVSIGGEVLVKDGEWEGEGFREWTEEGKDVWSDSSVYIVLSNGDTSSMVLKGTCEVQQYTAFAGSQVSVSENWLFGVGVRGSYKKSRNNIFNAETGEFEKQRELKRSVFGVFSGLEYKFRSSCFICKEGSIWFGLQYEVGKENETVIGNEEFLEEHRTINSFNFSHGFGVKLHRNLEFQMGIKYFDYGVLGFNFQF